MIAVSVIVICLSPFVVLFILNGGNIDTPRSPRVGR